MSCPTPGKATYATTAAARAAAVRIRCDHHGPTLEPYPCSCGSFHLTSGSNLTARIRTALKGSR
jgi:hypothetical protein